MGTFLFFTTKNRNVPIFLDNAGGVLYNARVMDSLSVFEIPTGELSSLLLWNWWAVQAAR